MRAQSFQQLMAHGLLFVTFPVGPWLYCKFYFKRKVGSLTTV